MEAKHTFSWREDFAHKINMLSDRL